MKQSQYSHRAHQATRQPTGRAAADAPSFSYGSPIYHYDRQASNTVAGPSNSSSTDGSHHGRFSATGATDAAPSYYDSSSGWIPPPVFPYHTPQGHPDPDAPQYSYLDKFASLDISAQALPTVSSPLPQLPSPEQFAYYPSFDLNQFPLDPMAITLPPVPEPTYDTNPAYLPSPGIEVAARSEVTSSSGSTEKRNPCSMCHKAFDRPSTLKKHMLVHTGEKAHVCTACKRRFSVASNLNRHLKICKFEPREPTSPGSSLGSTAPEDASSPGTDASPTPASGSSGMSPGSQTADGGSSSSPGHTSSTSGSTPSPSSHRASTTRGRKRNSLTLTSDGTDELTQQKSKRRRRPPSPSRWVPDSLRMFDLTPLAKAVPVPLPPVQPFVDPRTHGQVEERDSFAEDASANPYHPNGWRGRLPGPALLVQESMGVMGGRLLVF